MNRYTLQTDASPVVGRGRVVGAGDAWTAEVMADGSVLVTGEHTGARWRARWIDGEGINGPVEGDGPRPPFDALEREVRPVRPT